MQLVQCLHQHVNCQRTTTAPDKDCIPRATPKFLHCRCTQSAHLRDSLAGAVAQQPGRHAAYLPCQVLVPAVWSGLPPGHHSLLQLLRPSCTLKSIIRPCCRAPLLQSCCHWSVSRRPFLNDVSCLDCRLAGEAARRFFLRTGLQPGNLSMVRMAGLAFRLAALQICTTVISI